MPAAFDNQPQIVLTGEVHSGGNVARCACGNGISTRSGRPRVDPAERLREAELVGDPVRVANFLQETLGGSAAWSVLQHVERKVDREQVPADLAVEALPCGR